MVREAHLTQQVRPFGMDFWMRGLPLPGDEGEKYWPRGYKIEQIGPDIMRGKGGEYWRESKERLARERGGVVLLEGQKWSNEWNEHNTEMTGQFNI